MHRSVETLIRQNTQVHQSLYIYLCLFYDCRGSVWQSCSHKRLSEWYLDHLAEKKKQTKSWLLLILREWETNPKFVICYMIFLARSFCLFVCLFGEKKNQKNHHYLKIIFIKCTTSSVPSPLLSRYLSCSTSLHN